jgi:hypothetical protein
LIVDIKGLFADFDTTSNRLGNTVKDKNLRLAAVLKGETCCGVKNSPPDLPALAA